MAASTRRVVPPGCDGARHAVRPGGGRGAFVVGMQIGGRLASGTLTTVPVTGAPELTMRRREANAPRRRPAPLGCRNWAHWRMQKVSLGDRLPKDELCHDASDAEGAPKNGHVQLWAHARAASAS